MKYLAVAVAWVSTACVVGYALSITSNPWCIVGLLIPAVINTTHSNKEEEEYKNDRI